MPGDEDMEEEKIELSEEENDEQLNTIDLDNSSEQENNKENEKLFSQKELEEKITSRVSRAERKAQRELEKKEKELEKFRQLESTLKAGLEVQEGEDVFQKVSDFYKEQGVDIPKYESVSNKKDAERLGEFDAKDLIETADIEEIKDRANELASLKTKGTMTARENTEFMKLGSYLTEQQNIMKLKESGVDESVLNEKEFKEFSKKFNSKTDIADIYGLYAKLNHKEVEKPASTGSVKSTVGESKEKKYYSSEEVDKLTAKDLDNPTILKNVMSSMKKWGKR